VGCEGRTDVSRAPPNSGLVLGDAETAAGCFSLDHAGCSAKGGCTKKSTRNGEVSTCAEAIPVAGFLASSRVLVGKVPAGLKFL